jgi:PAS domain S-box-containing protein
LAAETPKFAASLALLRAEFTTSDGQAGSIDVGYIEDCPVESEGPFLKEERALLDTLADMLRTSYDRQQIEMAMRESEERFRAIAETIPATVFIYNSQHFAYVNPACEILTGYSRDELLNMDIWELVHPEMRDAARERIETRLRGEFITPRFDFKLVTKSGEVRWAYSTIAGITYKGKPSTLSVVVDFTERKQAEEHFKTTSEQLRALTASLRSAREAEGIRIAREIHDELGSALTSLRWDLESLEKEISESGSHLQPHILLDRIVSMRGLIDTTISAVRRIASELRPSILDDLGLAEAIEWQAQQFQARTGVICQFHAALDNLVIGHEQATAIFRIFQEALTNILRHAQATTVTISIVENANSLILTIGDDGIGITDSQKSTTHSIGLLGMRERAHLIGGEINITGVVGQGIVVSVRIPIAG